ncbi:MAG: 3-hydroxybutyryl-CoA dehydrogenase, partial [Deltaproteobacteria bacterium]|nr:3-hydroxybutyryl-CoA dehydrogenase [Deltaproteobacteria bacterium]
MALDKVAIVGLGQMGRGILQVCAQAGKETYGYDSVEGAGEKAVAFAT